MSKKHTRFGQERCLEGLARAVSSLNQYRESAATWINRLQGYDLSEDAANSYLLQAYEQRIVGLRLLRWFCKSGVIHTLRSTGHARPIPSSTYSPMFWGVNGTRFPAEAALSTMRLRNCSHRRPM